MKLGNKVKTLFSSPEQTLKTLVFLIFPFLVCFSIMSDRRPYNYIANACYAAEVVLIVIYLVGYRRFVINEFFVLVVLFLLTILTSQILNGSIFSFPITVLSLSLFAFLFYEFLISLPQNQKILCYKLIVFGGLLFVLYFLVYYFDEIIHLDMSNRLGRDFSDQNDLAKNMALCGIISEILAIKTFRKEKIFYIISVPLFFFLILLTGSISNLLLFSLVTAVLLLYVCKKGRRVFVIVGLVASLAVFIILLQFPFMSYFKVRIENMLNSLLGRGGSVDYSATDRYSLALYGLKLFTSKPVFGYGYDQVQFFTMGKNAFSHNNFIELLASFGILGFMAFETILLYPMFKSLKKKNKELALFSLLYLFAFQMFLIIFRKKIEYMLIPLAFSLIDDGSKFFFIVTRSKKKISFQRYKDIQSKRGDDGTLILDIH